MATALRLLKDADEIYPAWLEAIRSAEKTVYFENYIIRGDKIGQQFSDALIARAKEGVRVRLCTTGWERSPKPRPRSGAAWTENGVEVRCFNPPHLDSPLGWLSRLHRKSLCR